MSPKPTSLGRAPKNAVKLRVESLEDRLTPAYAANTVAFQNIDLIPGGPGVTAILDGIDDTSEQIDIGPNTFNFYGQVYSGTALNISSNGLITFGTGTTDFTNGSLDTDGTPQATIAALWDDWVTSRDLDTGPSDDIVLYTITGSRLTVEWSNVYRYYSPGSYPSTASSVTFQAILQLNTGPNHGAITFNYVDLDTGDIAFNDGASATIGIKNFDTAPGGKEAITLSHNAANYTGGAAIRFTEIIVPPTIAISGAASVSENSTYTLNLGAVTNPGHSVSSYTINWGDGFSDGGAGTPENSTFTHTYADGTNAYDITVDLDDDRASYTDTANPLRVTVVDVPPTIALTGASSSAEGAVYTLSFGAVTDPGLDTPTSFVVDWGDGTSQSVVPGTATATHTYTSRPTAFDIAVSVVNEDGTFANVGTPISVTVANIAPTAAIATGPTASNEAATVTYTGTLGDAAGALDAAFTYRWRVVAANGQVVPDGTGSIAAANFGTVPSFSFTPRDNGVYTVSLTVTDKDGTDSAAATRILTVRNLAPTATLVNDGPQNGTAPVRVSFVGSADPSSVDAAALRYSYDFNNDGDFTDPGEISGSTSSSATYVAPTGGSLGVRGRISDKDGGFNDYFTAVKVPLGAAGVGKDVVVYFGDGTTRFALRPYEGYVGNITLAVGDVTGDGIDDIVTGTETQASHVKVFDGSSGAEIASFLAYQGFTGGVSVAVGDVLGRGYGQVITGAGPGGGPHVKVFDLKASGEAEAVSFFAYDEGFLGGVRVSAGRFDSRGRDLLVTGAGPGGGSHIKVFDVGSGAPSEVRSFFAFDFAFAGGVSIAAANGQIAIGTGAGGGGQVALYRFSDSGLGRFPAYTRYNGDVRVSFGTRSGVPTLETGSGPGVAPTVHIFRLSDLELLESFFLGSVAFDGGVYVG